MRIVFFTLLYLPVIPLLGQSFQEVEFQAPDGLLVTADLYFHDKSAPTLVLFHQSVSSRGEYRSIAPRLQALGFNCLAVDLRWGKRDFWEKVSNETAKRFGAYEVIDNYDRSQAYQLQKVWPIIWKAYDDIKASLSYLEAQGFTGKKLVMGSSFSAMLVFKLAHDQIPVDGILAFSPGEYHPTDSTLLETWVKSVEIPVYLSAGQGEAAMVASVGDLLPNKVNPYLHHSQGRHGASVLQSQPADWEPLEHFLTSFLPASPCGFQLLELSRESSTWQPAGTTKPINAYFWYPTDQGSERPITYRDYVNAIKPEQTPEENANTFHRIMRSLTSDTSLAQVQIDHFLQSEKRIYVSAPIKKDDTPLVVLSGAHPIYFTALAEALCSQGYATVSVPRVGLKKGERLPFDKAGVRELESDLSLAIDYLMGTEHVDGNQLAFISWSFEGVPAHHLAAKYNAALAISLDAAVGYGYGIDVLEAKGSQAFPLIHFTGKNMDYGKDLRWLQERQSQTDQVRIDSTYDLSHGQFTSLSSLTIPRILGKQSESAYPDLISEIQQLLHQHLTKETESNN